MQQERGSALLITMVVITVAGTLALASLQFTLSTFRQLARLDDAQHALSAAHSGLEDALLRWRFSKNAQVPAPSQACPNAPTANSNLYTRINLSGTVEPIECVAISEPPRASNNLVYDLKISHRLEPGVQECVGDAPSPPAKPDDICLRTETPFALAQDTPIEYSLESLSSSFINIDWQFSNDNLIGVNRQIELISLADTCPLDGVCNRAVVTGQDGIVNSYSFDLRGGTTLRFKAIGRNVAWYVLSSQDTDDQLDTRFTNIEVVGYFGGTKKKLRLILDRLTGSALPLYDYVLFSGEGSIDKTSAR